MGNWNCVIESGITEKICDTKGIAKKRMFHNTSSARE